MIKFINPRFFRHVIIANPELLSEKNITDIEDAAEKLKRILEPIDAAAPTYQISHFLEKLDKIATSYAAASRNLLPQLENDANEDVDEQ